MTEQQKALLRNAQDSLRAAKLLAQESLHAFAISRAYTRCFMWQKSF